MKININFPKLGKLVNKMGAEKINWVSGTKSKKIDLSKLFTIEGLDVKFNELQIKEHGFNRVWNTENSFCHWLGDLQNRKIIPSSE